jgi:malate dehydrogenase
MLATVPMTLQDYSRIDLLRANTSLYQLHGQAIERVAPTARVLVVAEPCNSLCLLVQRQARTVPAEHFFSLTHVDRMRATALIAAKANVPVSQIRGVNVWGNRSDTAYVDLHNTTINDTPADQVISEPEWSRNVLQPQLAERSHEVDSFLGKSAAATATQAILGTIRSITTPTPYGRRFSAGVVSDGSYGVPKGLVFGFPLRTEDGKSWSIVQGLYLDDYALSRLEANVAELEREAAIAGL